MAEDTAVVTTTEGFGSRLKGSCSSVVGGLVFGVAGIALLVWNEGNYVRQHKALEEGIKAVVDLGTNVTSIDPRNENKLIHVIGYAHSNTGVEDTMFGLHLNDTIKLDREVEMYQWVEDEHRQEKKETGGSKTTETTYTYSKEWKSEVINSDAFYDSFRHENPKSMPYESDVFVSPDVSLGAFQIPFQVLNAMNWFAPYNGKELSSVDTIPDESIRKQAQPIPHGYYFGNTPNAPQVGDTRVAFSTVHDGTISLIARQTANTFTTYTAKSGGGTILIVEQGTHDVMEMFEHAKQSLKAQTWILRLVGTIMIYVLFRAIAEPLVVFSDVLPFLGNCVGGISDVVAFLFALAISTVVIAIAWLAYRPVFAIGMLILAGVVMYVARKFNSKRHDGYTPAPASAESSYVPTAQAYEVNYGNAQDDEQQLPSSTNPDYVPFANVLPEEPSVPSSSSYAKPSAPYY